MSHYVLKTNDAPKGTHRTRLNAYKHGLTGQIRLLTGDEQAAFEAHCKGIVEALAPVGALELDLAQSIAEGRWRLKRICVIESNTFALGQRGELGHTTSARVDPAELLADQALSQAHTWLAKAGNIQLFTLYEQRIQRAIERNMAELRTLRAERKAARDQALEEAQILAQHAQTKGETYDPARDFPPELLLTDSVFSVAGIARLIARHRRLAEARAGIKNPPDTKMRAAA